MLSSKLSSTVSLLHDGHLYKFISFVFHDMSVLCQDGSVCNEAVHKTCDETMLFVCRTARWSKVDAEVTADIARQMALLGCNCSFCSGRCKFLSYFVIV